MGRNSGGVTSGGTPKGRGDVNYKGKITGLRDLVTVKDKAVYKELKEGISRYHTMLGVRQKDVRVGTMWKMEFWVFTLQSEARAVRSSLTLSISIFQKLRSRQCKGKA